MSECTYGCAPTTDNPVGPRSKFNDTLMCDNCYYETLYEMTCDNCGSKKSKITVGWLTGEAIRECTKCHNRWI